MITFVNMQFCDQRLYIKIHTHYLQYPNKHKTFKNYSISGVEMRSIP